MCTDIKLCHVADLVLARTRSGSLSADIRDDP